MRVLYNYIRGERKRGGGTLFLELNVTQHDAEIYLVILGGACVSQNESHYDIPLVAG